MSRKHVLYCCKQSVSLVMDRWIKRLTDRLIDWLLFTVDNVHKYIEFGCGILCSQDGEFLLKAKTSLSHTLGEITVFLVIVRWKPFLFLFLNVTGFSADSHRSTSLKCEVLIGNGSLWTSQSPRHIDIQWHLQFNKFFFYSSHIH